MPIETPPQILEPSSPPAAPEDLTGHDRMVGNVLAGWVAHFAFIVAGFVMPRMMDRYLGQTALGVWDFGWTLVAYFALVQGGVVASVNRYVAKYRAAGDADGVNRAVSSVSCILGIMGIVVAVVTVAAMLIVPRLLSARLGDHVGDAKYVVLLLGLSAAGQIAFAGFAGVISGCHRWALRNAIEALSYLATVAAMIVLLCLGGGLVGLALVTLVGEAVTWAVRGLIAYRVLPGLRVRLALARWSEAQSMLAFGGKSFIIMLAELVQGQTASVLIISFLGAAPLALFSRPRSLVAQARTLLLKFTYVLGSTASSVHAVGHKGELRQLFLHATRYGAYMALPMVLMLAILGGPLLLLWMGERYSLGLLLAVLAVGWLPSAIQESVLSVLWGMNAHGRAGVAKLTAALCAIGLLVFVLGVLRWDLCGAALAIALPLVIADGVYIPWYACRLLGVSIGQYIREALLGPVACAVPFALALVGARVVFADRPLVALACGSLAGGAILALLYWRYALPHGIRKDLTRRFALLFRRPAPP